MLRALLYVYGRAVWVECRTICMPYPREKYLHFLSLLSQKRVNKVEVEIWLVRRVGWLKPSDVCKSAGEGGVVETRKQIQCHQAGERWALLFMAFSSSASSLALWFSPIGWKTIFLHYFSCFPYFQKKIFEKAAPIFQVLFRNLRLAVLWPFLSLFALLPRLFLWL